MQATRRPRVWATALALIAGIVLGVASRPAPATPPPIPLPASPPSLPAPAPAPADPPAGELLIASASIQDPRFQHTVILLLRHDEKGAFGIIINRPIAEKSVASLIADAESSGRDKDAAKGKDKDRGVEGTIRVFAGGPVQPELGFVVHSQDYRAAATLDIDHIAAMTATIDVLRDIGHRHGPQKYFFALGYAGWGAGQLENEMARRDWFTTPGDAALIFDDDRNGLWQHALDRRSREL